MGMQAYEGAQRHVPTSSSLTVATLAASLTYGVALAQSTATSAPKWSQDKAKWNACNQDTKHRGLSGRKRWSYLYDCMTKA